MCGLIGNAIKQAGPVSETGPAFLSISSYQPQTVGKGEG